MKQNPVPAIQKHNKMVQAKNVSRNKMILDLRIAGMSEQAIADEMTAKGHPISDTSVHRIVRTALDRENRLLSLKQDQLLRHELDRLDKMTVALFANRNDPAVANALIKIMDRRAKYLGLDSPIKIDANNKTTGEMKQSINFTQLSDDKLDQLLALVDEATKSSE